MRFGESWTGEGCVSQPDSWRRSAEVAPDRIVETFPPGVHRCLVIRQRCPRLWPMYSSTSRTSWPQTSAMFNVCTHVHTDRHVRAVATVDTLFWGHLTKPTTTNAGANRICWNLVISLHTLHCWRIISSKSDTVWQSYKNIYRLLQRVTCFLGHGVDWIKCCTVMEVERTRGTGTQTKTRRNNVNEDIISFVV